MCFQTDNKGLDYPAKRQKTKQEKVFLTEEINHQPETPGWLNMNQHDSQVLWLSSFLHREISDVCSLSGTYRRGVGCKEAAAWLFSPYFLQARKTQGSWAFVKGILGSSLWGPEA